MPDSGDVLSHVGLADKKSCHTRGHREATSAQYPGEVADHVLVPHPGERRKEDNGVPNTQGKVADHCILWCPTPGKAAVRRRETQGRWHTRYICEPHPGCSQQRESSGVTRLCNRDPGSSVECDNSICVGSVVGDNSICGPGGESSSGVR